MKQMRRKNPHKSYSTKKKILLTCNDDNIRVTYSNWDRYLPQDIDNKTTSVY